eukprot:RCo027646
MADVMKNLARFPAAVPRTLANIQKLQRLHKLASDRRDKLAPIACRSYDREKLQTSWHPEPHTWVDEKLPMTRQEFSEYVWFKKDLTKLAPLALPLALGPIGLLGVAAWLNNPGWIPSSFSDKEDINEIKLEFYQKYGDEVRQKMGPMLQYRLKRLYRGSGNLEYSFLHAEVVESYKETFYSHLTRQTRDVRKAEHLNLFDPIPITLLLTNKDPLELTADLKAKLAKCTSPEEEKAILIQAYKDQELRGGPTNNHWMSLEIPGDTVVYGDTPDADHTVPPEDFQPIENLKLTGDRVFIPNDERQTMDSWSRDLGLMANEFLLLSFRFAPRAWNGSRFIQWYEEILQEDELIKRDGGVQKLSDLELKVALLDRAVMRVDEALTRGDMEARYKEISYLMSKRLPAAVILSWQTGYYRTTYSPEDDLPEPSILPKFNRTRLDVDTANFLPLEQRGVPVSTVHPALLPNAHQTLKAELATM